VRVCALTGWMLAMPPRVAAPELIKGAINQVISLIGTQQLEEGLCKLTDLTFEVHAAALMAPDSLLHYEMKSPLRASRTNQMVALVSHTAAGVMRVILDNENAKAKKAMDMGKVVEFSEIKVNVEKIKEQAVWFHSTNATKRLHAIMLSLWETTIALSPICKDAYILAARERIGVHSDASCDNWNIAAEWFRRAASLKRPATLKHELMWSPPDQDKTVYVDIAVNGQEITLVFPAFSLTLHEIVDATTTKKTTVIGGDEEEVRFLRNDRVWCRWAGLQWKGDKVDERKTPWFQGSIVEERDPFQMFQIDPSNINEMSERLLSHKWYVVKLDSYGEDVEFVIPTHHIIKVNSSGSDTTVELENKLSEESSTILNFCKDSSLSLGTPNPSNSHPNFFIPHCMNQVVESLMASRDLRLGDSVSRMSPISWMAGDAWKEDDNLDRSVCV
jgi:hypothetical protein